MTSAIWSPAGGIRYHVRAFRHREREWRPFRAALETWLAEWQPNTSKLAIVGPSGGYCLPLAAIQRFDKLIVFEPDPLARFVLRRRLADRKVQFIADDVWIEPLLKGGSLPTPLLQTDTALLFSNFIGQLPFLVPPKHWDTWRAAWCKQLWPLLQRIPWASFHDRVSGSVAPHVDSHAVRAQRFSDEQVRELYEPERPGQIIELLDHSSQELLPEGRAYRYFHWPLTTGAHHLIEGVFG